MREGGRKHYFLIFILFEDALIVGGWGLSEGWWGGAESLICIFVFGVTQGNEDAEPVQPLPVFSLFQEPCTITQVMEEIFKVKANEDIEYMDLCDFTQDTSPTQVPPENHRLHPPY